MKFFKSFHYYFLFCIRRRHTDFAHLPIPGSILGILFILAFEMHLVDPEKSEQLVIFIE